MKLETRNKNDLRDTHFTYTFRIIFDGLCEFSFEGLREQIANEYGNTTAFFEDVEIFWNEFFQRFDLECKYGDGWLGYIDTNIDEGVFDYIKDTDYRLINAHQNNSKEKSFEITLSIPRLTKRDWNRSKEISEK